jgi:hypothetical protein
LPARRGQPSGRCVVCTHPDKVRIELLLAGGSGQKAVGRKFGISKDSVWRHWTRHVDAQTRARLIMGPVQMHALAAQIAEENTSVLENLRVTRAGLYQLYDAALEAGDRTAGALIAGKIHQNLQITARITGELASSPLISINNTQNNNAVLADSPAFAAFQARLMRVLSDIPGATAAVIAEFERVEAPRAALTAPPDHVGEIYENETPAVIQAA